MWATTASGFGVRANSRASWPTNRAPRPGFDQARNRRTRQFGGSTPGTAPSANTTTSSSRRASAAIFDTVAASAGWLGSTCCVTKIKRLIGAQP